MYYCTMSFGAQQRQQKLKVFQLFSDDNACLYHPNALFKKAIRSPGPNYPRLWILLLHVPLNTNICVLLLRNSVLIKARRRLQCMLIFWPRELKKPKKNAGNRLPREVDCPRWELLLLSLSSEKKLW